MFQNLLNNKNLGRPPMMRKNLKLDTINIKIIKLILQLNKENTDIHYLLRLELQFTQLQRSIRPIDTRKIQ